MIDTPTNWPSRRLRTVCPFGESRGDRSLGRHPRRLVLAIALAVALVGCGKDTRVIYVPTTGKPASQPQGFCAKDSRSREGWGKNTVTGEACMLPYDPMGVNR